VCKCVSVFVCLCFCVFVLRRGSGGETLSTCVFCVFVCSCVCVFVCLCVFVFVCLFSDAAAAVRHCRLVCFVCFVCFVCLCVCV